MEMLLLVVTMVSLATAVLMGAIAWRGARDERLRSAARVAALRTAAERDALFEFPQESTLDEELPLRADEAPAASTVRLFGAAGVPAGAARQRGLAWAAGALFVMLAAAGMALHSGDTVPASPGTRSAPLELLTLTHERAGASVSVSGIVRNPEGGSMVERLTAVVLLFDGDGGFLSSARAPVDFLKLAPGDDTPFVIALPAPPSAARYRVSFRTDAGVVPHVDKRAPAAAAADASVGTR